MIHKIMEGLVWACAVSTSIALSVVLTLALLWLLYRQRKSWLLRHIPGPSVTPLFHVFLGLSAEERVVQLYRFGRMGEVVKIWSGFFYTCIITSARGVETILTNKKYIHKGLDYEILKEWFGDGILTSTGSKWHSRRKLLTPAFHLKILEDFVDVFNRQSKILVKRLQEKADGSPFNVMPYVALYTLDVICETAMGIPVNAQINSESEFVQAVIRLADLVVERMTRPWLRPNWIYKCTAAGKEYYACLKILHGMCQETIKERRALLKNSKKGEGTDEREEVFGEKRRLAFLDVMLQYSKDVEEFTEQEIRDEVNTIMSAGHDTTTAGISWVLYLLGLHEEIQTRVHEEMDSIFGDSDRPVTMEDLRSMKLLENCMKEALRLFPPAHRFVRTLKEDVMICDLLIPSGTNVLIFPFGIHRDPKHFPDPEKFDPDRFLPENVKHRHPYAYIPFSAGPRNCIGQKFAMMEEKVLLSSILRKFRVESTVPREELRLEDHLVLRAKGGILLKFFTRT